jgi:hypothetical protein
MNTSVSFCCTFILHFHIVLRHSADRNFSLYGLLQGYDDYLETMLARLDCLRRQGPEAMPKLQAAFRAADELLTSFFPEAVDKSFKLTSYWADCEAKVRMVELYGCGRCLTALV